MSTQIVHITDTHCSFDDRIFYKELVSFAKKYECYQIVLSADKSVLRDMGGNIIKPGKYNNVNCIQMQFSGGNIFIIKCIRKFLPKIYKNLKYFKLDKKIIKYFKLNNITPSIIHYHDLTFYKTAYAISQYYNCKLIFDCHEFYFSYPFDNGLTRKHLRLASAELLRLKRAVKNSNYVISVTKNLDSIISLIKKDENHSVIYNSSIIPLNNKDKIINPEKKLTLVHEGSIGFDRGLKLMLDMFKDDYIRNNFKLKIIGKIGGREKEYFDSKVKELNLNEENLECTGWVKYEELSNYLKGDIGIIFFEKTFNAYFSMPNRLFNYHCAGIPVICSKCADLTDMILSTKTGVMFERNIDSLRDALKTIKENYVEYYNNVRNEAYKYHWDLQETNLYSIYEEVLNNK